MADTEPIVLSPPAPGQVVAYSGAKSARKAGTQTAASAGVLILTIVAAVLADPRAADYVAALAKKAPWLPLLFLALRMAAGVVMDRLKHRGPDGELVESAPPVPVPVEPKP